MAFNRAFTWMSNILILTLAISLSFVQSFSSCLPYGTNMVGNRAPSTTSSTEVGKFGNEASVGTVVDSARQVPTGPDPLHHHDNPIGP